MDIVFSTFAKITFAVSLPFAIYGLYFVAISLLGFRKQKTFAAHAPKTRFALVVAARNEQGVIGNLIDSLNSQNYPREMFDIIVAPNNCTDSTEYVSSMHGAKIFHHTGKVKSKGEVLSQIVSEVVLKGNYGAMCVFDADNLAEPEFLSKMNNAIQNGSEIAQGVRDSKNSKESVVSGWYSIYYWMLNQFYNRSRSSLGLSGLILGSGFAVTTNILRRMGGWNTVTLTEDYEFSARAALLGARVDFCDAIVYDEQPLTFNVSWKQRRRWASGNLQGLRLYGFSLLKSAIKNKNAVCFDMLLTFLLPVFGIISCALGILSAISLGVIPMIISFVASLIIMMLGTAAVATLTTVISHRSLKGMLVTITSFWLFLVSHMAIVISCLFKVQTNWDPIVHTNASTISDVNIT